MCLFGYCSSEKALMDIELPKRISRWGQSDPEYVKYVEMIESDGKRKILVQLHQDSCERKFLESLLSKYCGEHTITIFSGQRLTV